jgi:hypothetical protein
MAWNPYRPLRLILSLFCFQFKFPNVLYFNTMIIFRFLFRPLLSLSSINPRASFLPGAYSSRHWSCLICWPFLVLFRPLRTCGSIIEFGFVTICIVNNNSMQSFQIYLCFSYIIGLAIGRVSLKNLFCLSCGLVPVLV